MFSFINLNTIWPLLGMLRFTDKAFTIYLIMLLKNHKSGVNNQSLTCGGIQTSI